MSAPTQISAEPEQREDGQWRRDFRWRWFAQAASEAGTAVGYTALSVVAVLALNASDFQVSLLSVLSGVVAAVLALPMGPWIEFHRKRPVMIGADLLRFATIGSIPVAAYFGWLTYWQLCAVAVVRMVATLAFNSASTADLKNLVPKAYRTEANSRFETTLWTANTFGPPAGGLLISWLGATASLVVDAVSYLASVFGLRKLRKPEPPAPHRPPEHHWVKEALAGWRYIFGHASLNALFWNSLVFGGCIMASSPLITVFMLRDKGFQPWQYGMVFGVSGVAGIAGSLLVQPLVRRFGEHAVLLGSGAGRNLWLGLIPLASSGLGGLVLITVANMLLLIFVGVFNPMFFTYRMNGTDDQYMSRVMIAWSISSRTAQPIFIAAGGVLAAATSARTAMLVLAAVLLTATALLPWRRRQQIL